MKRVGILTSGGDAPGMNACIRAVVRDAITEGIEVMGIRRGYRGLIEDDVGRLSRRHVAGIIQSGGSILESSRCPEFETREGRNKAARTLRDRGIEGVVLIGGDGTFRGAAEFSEETDVGLIGVPGTIDNDLYGTDYTIGFDTAVNCAMEAIDRVRDIAQTFERVFFVEVMGNHTGFLALHSAVAGGAEGLMIPEMPANLDALCSDLKEARRLGDKSAVVVVSETKQPGRTYEIAQGVSAKTGFESRVCILGYLQRGGRPTARDRLLGSQFGVAALQALKGGEKGQMVGERGGSIEYTPLRDTYEKRKGLDSCLTELARILPATPDS